ncbi:B12-binding domain-containing radical SAM protein [archaeon]|jgi:anaerobic magnesium-protoporphyrin IX monomethyl ester cyclase|nr:B12-binding domain-containing radical SAM protein [archaeon]
MKILLVIPRYALTNKRNYEYTFPLGLAYISSVMKKEGYDVDCLNLNHYNGTTNQILNKKLNSKKYDIVCSGHIGIGYSIIKKITNISKSHPTKPLVIIGGTIITSEPKLMFESLKPDFAVVGEGEITIIELLDTIKNNKDLSKVNGIIYRKNNKTEFTSPRKVIENIDNLLIPDFESLNFEKQLENRAGNSIFDYPRIYPIMCSRGCPFQCTFCYHCLGFKYRERSIENVMEELRKNVKKYKINIINIYDDLFSINKKRLYKFCDEIKKLIGELDWECKWTCQLSVINVDKEMLKKLKSSGCYAVSFGFESYSQKVLDSMRKPITPKLIDNAIRLVFEEKMPLMGNFIFGDRAETTETAKETLDYCKKYCNGQIKIYFIQPYPGSEIYNHCIKKGIIKDKLNFIKNEISHITWYNMTDKMTDKEVLQLKKEILKTRRKYFKHIIPFKLKREKKSNKFSIHTKCPYCNKKIQYKNCIIENPFYYTIQLHCRECSMGYYAVSRPYKISTDYYDELDYLRKKYLFIRDNIRKKKI